MKTKKEQTIMKMRNTILKSCLLIAVIMFSACKKEVALDYKYSDKDPVVQCDGVNSQLISEAVYAFEDDITNLYTKARPNLSRSYQLFLTNASRNQMKFEDVVSKHTVDILNALKSETDLWNLSSSTSNLNYDSALMKCIANNMDESSVKATLNALLSTNSLRPDIMNPALSAQIAKVTRDKNLSTYVALEYFFARMHDTDFSTVDFEKRDAERAAADKAREDALKQQQNKGQGQFNPGPNTGDSKFTVKETRTKKDPHAGHNHN